MRLLQKVLIVTISLSLAVYYSDSFAAATGAKSSKSGSYSGKHSRNRGKGKKQTAKAGSGDVWARIQQGIRIPRPSPASDGFGAIPAATIKKSSGSSPQDIKITDAIRAADEELARLTTVISPKKLPKGESQLSEKLRVRQLFMPKNDGNGNKTDESSGEKYTALGRLRFAKKEISTSSTESLSKKLHVIPNGKSTLIKSDSLFKSPSVQRIRTRLGLHPELFKNGGATIDGSIVENSATDKKLSSNGKTKVQQQSAIRNCADLKKEEIISLAQLGILSESYTQMAQECRIKQNAKVERVNKRIAGYSSGFLYQVSERARPYLYHIVDTLSKYGLPLDLALLPIVESAYQPTALSAKSAAGIWQFIPSTGSEYGLEQNDDYDARLDITASTQAAIRFLSGLNSHFKGDWLLALAAYNCGQGTVDAAISRNQAEGLDTDFWSLDLPAETQDYVPRLLALSTIFANPGSYGLKLRPIKNEPYFIKVNIDREPDIGQLVKKDLRTIAKLANFDPDQFGLLNSAYLKAAITQGKPFSLLMPISNANLLHQSLAFMAQSYKDEKNPQSPFLSKVFSVPESTVSKIQPPLLSISLIDGRNPFLSMDQPKPTDPQTKISKISADRWTVHYLDKGETLKAVAEYHGISEGELREFNKFKRRQSVSFGQRLLVPLKQIMLGLAFKKPNPSVLYKEMTTDFDPLHLVL